MNAVPNPLLPLAAQPLDPDLSAGRQALEAAHAIGAHWWGVLEHLREADACSETRGGTLPVWARELLGTWRQQHEAHDELDRRHRDAVRALAIAEGDALTAYEVWTRSGARLDGQHDFLAQAEARRAELAGQHPDAFVARVARVRATAEHSDPALLDTLLGRICWAGVHFGRDGEQDTHTVQDETGRTITVPAGALMAHPAFERLAEAGREQVLFHAQRRAAGPAPERGLPGFGPP
ncbi:hypothetical protein [Pseudorhodoferax sp.]|uniref:hypothetical protein n=1 Tax=Pseudorhodoferax sp. TaxID=1993553 RepID=UPI002DD6A87C|nr:hypothetical protein [Pseudorhodoferax sp.]